jgi:hypothetical protein
MGVGLILAFVSLRLKAITHFNSQFNVIRDRYDNLTLAHQLSPNEKGRASLNVVRQELSAASKGVSGHLILNDPMIEEFRLIAVELGAIRKKISKYKLLLWAIETKELIDRDTRFFNSFAKPYIEAVIQFLDWFNEDTSKWKSTLAPFID